MVPRLLALLLVFQTSSGASRVQRKTLGILPTRHALGLNRLRSRHTNAFHKEFSSSSSQRSSSEDSVTHTSQKLRLQRRNFLQAMLAAPLTLSMMNPELASASDKAATAEKRKKLPEGWQAVRDPISGDTYYWQVSTDITQWDFPGADQGFQRKVYTSVFGTKVEEPDLPLLWGKVVGLTGGLLLFNYGLEYQDKIFPSLKVARENMDFYYAMAKKYGQKEDEPLEEVGFRALEIARKERIQALANGAVTVMDDIGEKVQEVSDNADAKIADQVEASEEGDSGKVTATAETGAEASENQEGTQTAGTKSPSQEAVEDKKGE
eukprot:jgi/Bigna1/87676/estExt_fgenesh1_pg.C_230023